MIVKLRRAEIWILEFETMDTNEVGKGEKHINKGKEAQGKN